MNEPITSQMIRAYLDGELDGEQAARIEARVASDEAFRQTLESQRRFEHALRGRVEAVMTPCTSPANLRAEVIEALRTDALAEPVIARVHGDSPSSSIENPTPRRRRTFFDGPQRMNPFALAATIALVAGAVLFGIFGTQIDERARDVSPSVVANAAQFAATEHGLCATDAKKRERKERWKESTVAATEVSRTLGTAVRVFDLSSAGYRFDGAGPCGLPGGTKSSHLLYAKDAPDDLKVHGVNKIMASVFIAPNVGQYPTEFPPGKCQGGEWRDLGSRAGCAREVISSSDGSLVYFIVCCDERDLPAVAAIVAQSQPSPK